MSGQPGEQLSIYSLVREASGGSRPAPHLMSKDALLRLSRELEAEVGAAPGNQGVLVGSFQRDRFFRQSERKWQTLAKHVGNAIVLAAFEEARFNGALYEIPIAADQPISREWSIVFYHSSTNAFALAGREVWLQKQRHFETSLVRSTPVVFRTLQLCGDYIRAMHPEAAKALTG